MQAARPRTTDEANRDHEGLLLDGGRIRLGRRLGSGGMGTVYEAWEGRERIAVKVLNRLDAADIYRLKTEFRRLIEVSHVNVVAARELIAQDGEWFFSMEAVTGVPLDVHVRRSTQEFGPDLRCTLRQLVEGVAAIHAAGLLHRDLKPTNVLVEPDGHVVILDFGLVSEQYEGGAGQTVEGRIAGTPGYMAPEQAQGLPATTATDWYAFGAMLYQLLTGHLPFSGSLAEVLTAKRRGSAPPPRSQDGSVPEDLDALCMELLQPVPTLRPSTSQMLTTVASWPSPAVPRRSSVLSSPASIKPVPFVGRAHLVEEFRKALEDPSTTPQVLWFSGGVGLGKTALLRRCKEVAREAPRTVALLGGCYKQETVPFKAFDELVDAYTRLLMQLPADEAARMVPRNLGYAARLFPVLLRVDAFQRAANEPHVPKDETELTQRRKAYAGLKDLINRMAERTRVVLLIDDMQWADADSERLLLELVAPPDPPPVLWVFSSSDQGSGLPESLSKVSQLPVCIRQLRALSETNTARLVEGVWDASHALDEDGVRTLVAAAGGIPLYAVELARYCESRGSVASDLSLDMAFCDRLNGLSDGARRLLELACVAVSPLPLAIASQIMPEQAELGLRELLRAGLLDSRRLHDQLVLRPRHDGVARAVVTQLAPEQRCELHTALADVLERSADVDPQWVVSHLMAANLVRRAAERAVHAGDDAAGKLAFGRAADLYLMAIENGGPAADGHAELEIKCAVALANAGRSFEAAQAYLRAAAESPPEQAVHLRRMAASQWLRGGHVREGVAQLQRTFAETGLHWPSTLEEAGLRFLLRRAHIRIRGLDYKLRDERDVPRETLAKLDALYPAQTSLGTFDYVRGAYFSSVALPLALEAGEPSRLVLCLGAEAAYGSMFGGQRNDHRGGEIRARLAQVAQRTQGMYGQGLARLTDALCAYWEGDWQRVLSPAREGESLFDSHVNGAFWEVSLLRSIRHTVDLHAGHFLPLMAELPGMLLEAVDRQDVYSQLDLTRRMAGVQLARGDFELVDRHIAEIETLSAAQPLPSLSHLLLSTRVSYLLYCGRPREAREALEIGWKRCRRMSLHRLPLLRTTVAGMKADCLVAAEGEPMESRRHELLLLARDVAKEPIGWARALGHSIEASAHLLDERIELAERCLRRASDGFEAVGMLAAAAADRLKLERLVGTPMGTNAEQALEGLGIRNPDRWMRQYRTLY